MRRLLVLIRALPPAATVWAEVAEAHKKAQIPSVDQIKARRDHYARQAAKQRGA